MALRRVDLSTDVYFVCLNHAMCTEGEEIVGLLVGEVDEERIAHVVAVLILRRSDKRKDRVEISPEQLSNASTEAEKLACILKRPVRVVGWYHSHPKLTVYPSLVDVCTQESYQLMDEGFIGMIFSVFNTDPNKFGGRIQMICYQSQTVIIDCNVEKSHIEIPIQLVPSRNISDVCMNSVVQLPRFLCQEEQLAYQMANQVPLDYLTRLHNSSVYLRKMGQIAEVICGPLLKMLEERILNNEMKRKRLQERKKALTAMVDKARTEKTKREQERAKKELDALQKEKEIKAAQLENQDLQLEPQAQEQETQNQSRISAQRVEVSHVGDQEVPHLKEFKRSPDEAISVEMEITSDPSEVRRLNIVKAVREDDAKMPARLQKQEHETGTAQKTPHLKRQKIEEVKVVHSEKSLEQSSTLISKTDCESSSAKGASENAKPHVISKNINGKTKLNISKDSTNQCNNLSGQRSNADKCLPSSSVNVTAQDQISPSSSLNSSEMKILPKKSPTHQSNI
uniref:Lys-63-specific deubiquitinase n=1 Tax=Parasteatoda tepidariorum TaxID=114398 RepID=A0A2L2YIJ2_PARTP